MPQDLHGSYRRLDQSLQQIHVDATYDVAVALGGGAHHAARLARRRRRVRDRHQHVERRHAASTRFIKRSARARCAARSTADEVDVLHGGRTAPSRARSAAGYADVIGVCSTAPSFMYFVEHGDKRGRRANRRLRRSRPTSSRRASRISSGRRRPTTSCWHAAADG